MNADDGRSFDFDFDWCIDAFVGGLIQSFHLDHHDCDHGLWLGRLGR